MALVYTSDLLVEEVKNCGMIPEAQSLGSQDAQILSHLSEILQSELALELMKIREEYYIVTERLALTAGKTKYRIPDRAMGLKIRDLMYVDGSGDRYYLKGIPREELQRYKNSTDWPSGYYIEGCYINLVMSGISPTGYLEVSYYFRPSDLVLTEEAAQVLTVSTSSLTCTTVPSTFTVGALYDIHGQYSGAEIKSWSLVGTPGVGTMTFTAAIDGSVFGNLPVEVGDWVCLAGESVIPALPRELQPVLVRGAALHMAEAFGDAQSVQIHGALYKESLTRAMKVFENRVEGKPMRLTGKRSSMWS